MATKLTKTQQALIERAKLHGGRACVDTGVGRGARDGRVKWGVRERDALQGLIKLGLARVVHFESGIEFTGNGRTVSASSTVFELTA